MSSFPALTASLNQLIEEGEIPSVSVCVRSGEGVLFEWTGGLANTQPPTPASVEQIYDLASVTKALVGSSVAASVVSEGLLDPNAPVREQLPSVPAGITASHLLSHSSGYPAWHPFYEGIEEFGAPQSRLEVFRRAMGTPLQAPPGTAHVYSDIGYLTLTHLLETVGGERLDALFARHILSRMDLPSLTWGSPFAAATEDCPVRQRLVIGEVHDLNTASMGGISGHAGLFGSASDVSALAHALAFPGSPLHPLHEILTHWWSQPSVGSHRGGWDTPSRDGYTSTGRFFPDDAVGHLGYTGTSVWSARSKGVTMAILTNRVHPTDDPAPIRRARPRLHDALATDLNWPSGAPK